MPARPARRSRRLPPAAPCVQRPCSRRQPVTLLVAQAALFALSAVPVTRAAARLLGRRRGLALGLAHGLSWGVQRAVDFDFHEICFAVPLIAFSLEALLADRRGAALWWALPLVLVKEDLG